MKLPSQEKRAVGVLRNFFWRTSFMEKMKNVLFCTAFAVALLLSGCSGKKESAGASRTITVTDLAGREVSIKLPVKKANINWSGSGGAFMTMSALLGTDVANYLASWDDGLVKNRFDMYEEYVSKVPALKNIPVVGGVDTNDFNIEKLIASKPDVVIWTLSVQEQAKAVVEPALKQAGIPIVYIDHHAETVENHSRSTRLLGQIFEKEERAEEIVKFYIDNMNMIQSRIANAKTKPVVYMEVTSTGPASYGNTYSNNFMWGAMIVKAGGANMADGIVKNAAPVEAELVLSKDPDIIILNGSYWPASPTSVRMGYLSNEEETQRLLKPYFDRPGWRQLKAYKNGRVYAVHHGLGREVYDVAAVAFLAKSIHPDLFQDLDPMTMLEEYYDRFLPYDLYGVWMTKMR
jgi:iron complex transport system substrate-binding protein